MLACAFGRQEGPGCSGLAYWKPIDGILEGGGYLWSLPPDYLATAYQVGLI
jgi:hypothetical protein